LSIVENTMDLMNLLLQIADRAPNFALVLARVAGLMVLAPLLGMASVPIRIKAFIALILAMAVFPLVPGTIAAPAHLLDVVVGVAFESLIGVVMGFALMLIFSGAQIGAELISHQMGWSLAQLIDPTTEISFDVLSQFYNLLATLIFVILNGHLILIRSLAWTFQTIPLMGASFNTGTMDFLVGVLGSSFQLGIRVAGPGLTAIFLATLAMGFVSRTMPQLNILAIGFPINITLALLVLIASMGMICMLFQDGIIDVLHHLGNIFI
jgi:flagellar biosynthesis protein FliR